ncbi:MAG: flavin monoamine oxidase family protein, partial [Terriglobales bacterium]
AYIEGYEAADPDRISVQSLLREQAAAGDGGWPRRPRAGYDALVLQLAGGAQDAAHCNAAVHRLRWRPGEVVAECQDLQVRARAAIIALPLSLLQQGRPSFDPPIAEKRAALDQLVMGGALRMTLRLREPVWRGWPDDAGNRMDNLGFLFGPNDESGHFPTWWASEGGGAAQITGWAAGRHAWALAGWPFERQRQRALADLAARLRLAPERLERALIEAHSSDWQADPLALGAYSYAAAGGADAFGELARPLASTLFFAGEHTDATGRHATVQGALGSGRRAAEEALASK